MPATMTAASSPLYWDTSALLKCYAPEPDSAAFRTLLGDRPRAVICFVHRLEMAYALRQKEIRGEILPNAASRLTARFDRDADEGRFVVLPWGTDLVQAAREVLSICGSASSPIPLRTLDGIHLAAARVAGLQHIVTSDQRMRTAAAALGWTVVDP
jgi:uncharacterized protein